MGITNNDNKSPETFIIAGKWEEQSKNLKKEFSQLTDSDLKFEKGKETELLERLSGKLRKNKEEVIRLLKKHRPSN